MSSSSPPETRVRVQQDRALVAYLTSLIETVEAELAQLSQHEPWHAQVPFLLQLPGIGMITAMTVLASIGDVTRFASAKRLVGYADLGARIHASLADAALRQHHQKWANRTAHDPGGSGLDQCTHLALVGRTLCRTHGPHANRQSHCGDGAQALGRDLACVDGALG